MERACEVTLPGVSARLRRVGGRRMVWRPTAPRSRRPRRRSDLSEPESHTLASLRRLDEQLHRQHAETNLRLDRVEGRLHQIADELLVLNGIVLRLEGARSRPQGRRCSTGMSAGRVNWGAASPSWIIPREIKRYSDRQVGRS